VVATKDFLGLWLNQRGLRERHPQEWLLSLRLRLDACILPADSIKEVNRGAAPSGVRIPSSFVPQTVSCAPMKSGPSEYKDWVDPHVLLSTTCNLEAALHLMSTIGGRGMSLGDVG